MSKQAAKQASEHGLIGLGLLPKAGVQHGHSRQDNFQPALPFHRTKPIDDTSYAEERQLANSQLALTIAGSAKFRGACNFCEASLN